MAKSVLITGCSTGGIDPATAGQLAARGYTVATALKGLRATHAPAARTHLVS